MKEKMNKIRRMAKMYGNVDESQKWRFRVDVLVDGAVESFYFINEEKASWFVSKASKIADELQSWHKWGYNLLPW